MHELHSYLWQYYDEYKSLGIEIEDNIKLINATNPNIETLRRSIVPTQLCQVSKNTDYSDGFAVFEIGRIFDGVDGNNMCRESKKLAVTLFDRKKTAEELYLKLRDILAVLTDDIKHTSLSFKAAEAAHSYEHPKNLNTVICAGSEIGIMGVVHPSVMKKLSKKGAAVFAEIDIARFADIEDAGINYSEPSRFPEMEIDISFVSAVFAPIGEAIKKADCEWIKNVKLIDTYEDENGKSITVRIYFSHPERTLTKEEVMKVVDGIVETLRAEGIMMKK